MLSFTHVMLTQGEFKTQDHLRDFAKHIVPIEAPPIREMHAPSTEGYVANLFKFSTYTGDLGPGAQVLFLWINAQNFDVVLVTFPGGNLLRCSETIERALSRRLKQLDMNAEVDIDLLAPRDFQVYVNGKQNLIRQRLWDGLRNNVAAFLVGVIIAIISKIWLTQFFEEAIASLISLLLFTTWEAYIIWDQARTRNIHWRIND